MEWQHGGAFRPPETTYTQQGRPPLPRRTCELRTLRSYSNGVGLVTLGYMGVSLFSSGLLMLIAAFAFPDVYVRGAKFYAPEYVTQLMYIAAYVLSIAVPFLAYMLVIRIPAHVALPFRAADAGVTLGCAAVGMGLSVVANYLAELLAVNLSLIGISISMPELAAPTEPLAFLFYSVLTALLPALLEEAAFRGILMQSLRRFGDGFALVFSSLIFGLYHLNLVQMPFAFLLGLGLGYFTLRTGSLWCAVLVHFVNNASFVLLEYLAARGGSRMALMVSDSLSILWLVLGAFALCLLLMRDWNFFMLNPPPCSLPIREKAPAFCSTPLMITALVAAALFTLSYMSFGPPPGA